MAFKSLNPAEDTITTQITVTKGFFDGGVGTLAGSNLTTSSLSTTQKSYYYNLQYIQKIILVLLMVIKKVVVVLNNLQL